MLTLFYTPHTCALATLIMLEEVGAPYQLRWIDFGALEQRSREYLEINPKGRVPALLTEDGVLTETPALLTFVAQAYGNGRFLPHQPYDAARLNAFCSYLCSTVHVAHAHRMRGHRWADDVGAITAMQRKVPESVTAAFRVVEKQFEGPWVMGDQYTVADPYLFTLAQWLEADGADLNQLPRVLNHRSLMRTREAVQKALARESGE